MSATYLLVCEGPCNPDLPVLDAAVAAERTDTSRWRSAALSSIVLYRLNHLVHTAHAALGGPVYACAMCGTRRRF